MGKLIQAFKEGRQLAGPFMKLSDPSIVEIFGHAGFDFAIFDTEHGPLNMESIADLIRAARLVGISPNVRIRKNDPSLISQALDLGAEGILVPHISNAEAASNAVKASLFAPDGQRGVCCYVRSAKYSHLDKQEYFKKANESSVIIPFIEGSEGIKNLNEIISVKGIGAIFIGPYDLSQSMGVPGQIDHPQVISKIEEVVKSAKNAGLAVGTFVDDLPSASRWMKLGVQYIAYSVDVGIIYNASKHIVSELRREGETKR